MSNAAIRRVLFFILAFAFLASPAAVAAEEIPWEWSGIERIVVVGDLHGEYENFIKILKGTNVVDENEHWAAGNAHLVQTGDIMDRGDEARKIFDLLIRLEKEAEAAGGMVHVLLGNHEELNLTGAVFSSNSDALTLDQFRSFLPDSYRKQQEDSLRKKITKLRVQGRRISEKQSIDAFWESQRKNGSVQRLYLLNLNKEYGPWLHRLNVAIKINDVVFVHGGISEKYSKWGLQEINNRYRLELADVWRTYQNSEPQRVLVQSIIYRGDSPLWYRELANVPEADMQEEVDAILANLGARTMIIAHTPKIPRNIIDMQRFGGRVWIVDTGISRVYKGPPSALIIQNGNFSVWGVPMKTSMSMTVPILFFVALGPGNLIWPQPGGEEISRMEALEKVLREAKVEKTEKEILGGRTGPWLITLNAGSVKQRAVFRYVDRPRPHPTPDSYQYDIAAYVLTKHLGIELIPPVVEREIQGRKGTLQVFLENCIREKDRKRKKLEPPNPKAFSNALEEVKVLENLTHDECQDADHTYVHRDDWRVWRFDFSEAFAPISELIPGCEITVCSRRFFQGLLKLDEVAVKSSLGRYLSSEEIGALLTRKDLIIAKIKALIAENGEEAVLF
jgi:hypothetical protein